MASLERLRVKSICTPGFARGLDDAAVERLRQSIEKIGLLQPPVVRRIAGIQPEIVAGRHRLAACERAGIEIVECLVIEASNIDAELGNIAENLHRHELSEIERAELTARWVSLVAEKDAQQVGQLAHPVAKHGRPQAESGISKASRELGIERTQVRRRVKIAALADDAKDAAKAAGLHDNQRALLRAADKPKPQQAAEIRRIAAERKKPKPEPKADVLSPTRAALVDAWKRASKGDRRWFIGFVQRSDR